MIQVNINDKLLRLPMEELCKEKFSENINNNVIDLSDLDDNNRYLKINELFDFVAKSFVIIFDKVEKDDSSEEEYSELKSKMISADNLQKFFYKRGEIDKSINVINKILEKLLTFYEYMINKDIEEENIMKR